jgi:cation:H+ antiporter
MDSLDLPAISILFALSAMVVVAAGTRLARHGDVIAARTRLGGLWFGSVFLALATSLPELMTSLSATLMGSVDLAAGNLFGSSMANMLILALLTLLPVGSGLFSRAALDQVMGASLAIALNCLAGAFILARLPTAWAGVSLGTAVIVTAYLLGTRLLYQQSALARRAVAVTEMGPAASGGESATDETRLTVSAGPDVAAAGAGGRPSLRRAVAGFLGAAVFITAAAPVFAGSAARIADLTGVSQTVVGTTLVGLATSLPELVTSLAALRLGAFDLAVGNLFGSNSVNMLLLAPLDAAHRAGPIYTAIDDSHAISVLIAGVMMAMSLSALIYRSRRRFSMLEPTGMAMILVYLLGIALISTASN